MKIKKLGHGRTNKHALIMVLCCLIPLVALAVIWTIGVSAGYLIFVVILLCPVMHMFMMRNMHRQKPHNEDQ